jgi:tetratricopeptide (TPR) repeat protein
MRALAKAHLQNKEAPLAEETLRSALQANPADIPTRKDLAQLLLQQGKADQARAILDQLASLQGVSSDTEVIDAQFKAQLMAKDYAAAKQTAVKLQQLLPNAAAGWYYEGLAAEGDKSLDVARTAYEAALTKQADVAEPLAALVRLDIADKQSGRALARLDKVIAASPNNAVAYNLRGELLLADKQYAGAIAAFTKTTELAPKWWAPYRGLALAQLGNKQVGAAATTYQQGFDKSGGAVLATDLAALHERVGKPDEAIKVYEQWLQRDPKSMLAANNLAMLLLNYRNDKSSLDRAGKLADLLGSSSEPALLDTRGWVKFKSGDYQAAVNLLRQAANASADSNAVRYHLGMAQWKAGDAASARDNLQAVVKDNKPFLGMDEAKKALASLNSAG